MGTVLTKLSTFNFVLYTSSTMITYFQSTVLGLLQGATELFPVSSLGHSVILPGVFGWHLDQKDNYFLIFLVVTHLATSLVLLCFFRKDWLAIARGIGRSLKNRRIDPNDGFEKLAWLLVVTTVPAGILGLLFEEKLKILFASPRYASIFLFCNGLLLFGAERLGRRNGSGDGIHDDNRIAGLSWPQAVKVGFAQALALIPGFSRTGSTIGGGLLAGLNHADAARFSFLLATPIIFAAAVLKLPELLVGNAYRIGPLFVGALASAVAAYLSVRFLTKYFQTKTLRPFAWYCVIAGILTTIFFLVGF